MSHLSNFTGKFRVQYNTAQESPAPKVTRRPRESHVCNQCRKSKLKCDRRQPCGSCLKRNELHACSYRPNGGPRPSNGQVTTVESRLAHLEAMITDIMQQRHLESTKDCINFQEPAMAVENAEKEKIEDTGYAGFTHWSTVLDDIQELKAVLGSYHHVGSPVLIKSVLPSARDPIFGSLGSYSLQEIINEYLPSKIDVDRLLSICFQGETFIIPFIHSYEFQRSYQNFWKDPQHANPLWLSILFSVCCLASVIREKSESTEACATGPESARFHTAAGCCLVIGDYYRPQPYAVESLAVYAHCKSLRSLDPSREAGVILGMVIRMAYQIGYHRDPDSFGSFTVFEGEMRRRLWATIRQVDVMTSFQLGLPSNLCPENCDTRSPRNLLDSDFDVDTKVLPASRPESEPTKLLWLIVKDRQLPSFYTVCRDALSFTEKSDAELLQLDDEIRRTHATVPEILRIRPFAESLTDEPFFIMTRLYIEFIHLKSLCILHRKYMARGRTFSAKVCIDSGRQLVGRFIDMHKEISPGGRLYATRWMLTSYTMNDFLLGVMVLCLVVHTYRKGILRPPVVDGSIEGELLRLLRQSLDICVEKSPACKDAQRVSHILRLVLSKNSTPVMADSPQAVHVRPNRSLERLSLQEDHSQPGESLSFDVTDPFTFTDPDFEGFDWLHFDAQLYNLADEVQDQPTGI